MAHSPALIPDHTRLVRRLAVHKASDLFARTAGASNVTGGALRAAAAGGGSGSAVGGGTSAAAAADKLEMQYWNEAISEDLNIALALAVALFLLWAAPSAANWFASGRYRSGWMLSGRQAGAPSMLRTASTRRREGGIGEKSDAKAREAVVNIVERKLPLRVDPVGKVGATLRGWYNRVLLPEAPLFGLTWGQVAVCLAYEAIVVFCLFYKCLDHKSNPRRSGDICMASLPAIFLLASKNSLLTLIGKGYEKLNFLHRVAGRLAILGGLLHTLFYLLKTPFRPSSVVHVSGLVCTVACILILVTSVSWFRRRFYQAFLVSHIVGWISLIVALNFHVPALARPYTVFVLVIYGSDVLIRICKTRLSSASIVTLPGGFTMLQSHRLATGWRAGQHVWIRTWKAAGWYRGWETHPFTIANAPAGESPLNGTHNLTLLIKNDGDWVGKLYDSASGKSVPSEAKTIHCAFEGPYGGPIYTDFINAHAVVLIAAGSGMTFAASLFEELVHLATVGRTSVRNVTLVWTVKTLDALECYQGFLTGLMHAAREKTCLNVRIMLHVTRPPPGLALAGSLPSPIPSATVMLSRPSFPNVISLATDEVLGSVQRKGMPRGGGIVVGTCGPRQLVRDVRKAVAGVDSTKALGVGGITLHSETFGW